MCVSSLKLDSRMKLELLGLFLASIISAVTAKNGRGEVCELTEEEIKDLWSCHGYVFSMLLIRILALWP